MNAVAKERVGRSRPKLTFDIVTVWKQVTPELKAELLAMWERNQAMRDPAQAAARAEQAGWPRRSDEAWGIERKREAELPRVSWSRETV